MSNQQVTLKHKFYSILGGFLFTALVVTGVVLAVGPQEATAKVVMEQPANVLVFDTERRNVVLVAVDTPYAVCFYTQAGSGSPSAPSCISKAINQ